MLFVQAIIRILAFVRKELFGALRQPRLVLTLVLGPFIILALFAAGFKSQGTYNVALVVPDRAGVSTNPADYKELDNSTFHLVKVTKNQSEALADLNSDNPFEADTHIRVVVVVPADAPDKVYNGEHAHFPVFYRDLNPLQANYIEYSTYVYASEFDKVILRQILSATKPQTSQLQETTKRLNDSTMALDDAMRRGDIAQAKYQVQVMRQLVSTSKQGLSGATPGDTGNTENKLANNIIAGGIGEVQGDLNNIDTKLTDLDNGFNRGDLNSAPQRANLDSIKGSTGSLSQKAVKLANIPPTVMVSPVLTDAKNQVGTPISYINFYAPAVVILLLQHIALTLVSLSNVRDRVIGANEIFRVAPISPFQILTGKFLSFMLMLLVLAAGLIALLVQGLGVPFVNFETSWVSALAVVAATIYASIGMGILVGGLSRTDSQAVQLSMIVLLASIFFSGFVVPLSQFDTGVRLFGYALPMTLGTQGLQTVMLDNQPLSLYVVGGLLALGTIYMVLGHLLYRRQFARA